MQQKERKNKNFVTVKTKGFTKGLGWKDFGFGLYNGIKLIKSGFYGGDRAGIYFIFISILKLIKTILKLLDKYKKDYENDMAVDVAYCKYSNIKCYASTFSCEFKFLYLIFQHWKIFWAIIL